VLPTRSGLATATSAAGWMPKTDPPLGIILGVVGGVVGVITLIVLWCCCFVRCLSPLIPSRPVSTP
jgi:hypothetical protein